MQTKLLCLDALGLCMRDNENGIVVDEPLDSTDERFKWDFPAYPSIKNI